MSDDLPGRPAGGAKARHEREAREERNRARREHAAEAEIERRAIEGRIRDKEAAIEALLHAPSPLERIAERRIQELKGEITALGHALYLLKKTGKSGL